MCCEAMNCFWIRSQLIRQPMVSDKQTVQQKKIWCEFKTLCSVQKQWSGRIPETTNIEGLVEEEKEDKQS